MVAVVSATATFPIPVLDMSVLYLGMLQSLNLRGLQPSIARKDENGASIAFINLTIN